MLSMSLPAGKLLDMGYFRLTTIVGTLLYVFSWTYFLPFTPLSLSQSPRLFMLSICHIDKFYQLYLAQGLGLGIGACLLYVPSLVVQAQHWRSRRSLAMGIVATGL